MEPYCIGHDKEGLFRCDNQGCYKFLCFQCIQENDGLENILPSKICYFCLRCAQNFRTSTNCAISCQRTNQSTTNSHDNLLSANHSRIMYEGKDIQRGLVTDSKKREPKFSIKMNKLDSVRKQLFPSSQKRQLQCLCWQWGEHRSNLFGWKGW